MAKTGVFDSDPTTAAKATELKRELQKLARNIVEDDDFSVETIDQMQEMLSALKELKMTRPSSTMSLGRIETLSRPEEFRCPLSNELMRDPVILASGQTYDRPFILKWLSSGNRTCPKTQQVLAHTDLIPNTLIREMISKWCKNHGLDPASHVHHQTTVEEAIANPEHENFHRLLNQISSSTLPDKKSAAKELRLLTKRAPQFRALFGESPDAIGRLLKPLIGSDTDDDLQEDVITTLLNISIHESNKKIVCETPKVIPFLMESLNCGTTATRSNSAAAIFTLSALDSNKMLIGQSGALEPLIDLLEEGHPLAVKDVASAIFNLCIVHENRARAVRDGAVRVIVKKITEGLHVDELLAILAMLASHQKAVKEMGELDAVSCLLRILRENICERNKENAMAILHMMFFSDRTKCKEIRKEENLYGTISTVAQDGTPRAKRKANAILDRLRRGLNLTHTA